MTRLLVLFFLAAVGCKNFDDFTFSEGARCPGRFLSNQAGSCSPLPPQCGCEGASKNCVYVEEKKDFSCEEAGASEEGDTCGAQGDCGRGMGCYGGVCRRFCIDVLDCNNSALAYCEKPDEEAAWTDEKICNYTCDPVRPSLPRGDFAPCAPGQACAHSGLQSGSSCVQAAKNGQEGDACKGSLECGPGLVCLGNGRCARYCWVDEDDCGAGRCQALQVVSSDESVAKMVLGGLEVGVCIP